MNLGFPEMLFILVVALLIFGPKKLPEIGRQVGKAMSEFKRATDDFKSQLDSEVRQLELQESRQRMAASSSEPEVSISPPQGTVPATSAYGDVLDVDKGASTTAENSHAAEDATHRVSSQADSSHAANAAASTPAASTPVDTEMRAAASAENRNG